MNEIVLAGLRADLPIGVLAAFGCLRICERTPGMQGTRLAWRRDGGTYCALIQAQTDGEGLVKALMEDVRRAGERHALTWAEQVKTESRESYVEAIQQAKLSGDEESLKWFAAFGSEIWLNDGKITATPFDMSVARQKFLSDAVKLAEGLAKGGQTVKASYEEALFGPWKYADDQHSLGWDPTTMKLGAYTHKAPTGMANAGVRALVWLAFESLPLFPCFFNRRFRTRAFRQTGRDVEFRWPVWTPGITLAALESLLGLPTLLASEPSEKELEARGVVAIYRSTRFKPNKYLASFRMPELVYEGSYR